MQDSRKHDNLRRRLTLSPVGSINLFSMLALKPFAFSTTYFTNGGFHAE